MSYVYSYRYVVGLVVQQLFFSSNNVVYANLKHVSALLFVQFSNTLFRLTLMRLMVAMWVSPLILHYHVHGYFPNIMMNNFSFLFS